MNVRLKVDRFGRILIPKALREALALQPGAQLDVELTGGALILRPASRDVQTTRHHGRLILRSGDTITGDLVQDLREERLNEILGSW